MYIDGWMWVVNQNFCDMSVNNNIILPHTSQLRTWKGTRFEELAKSKVLVKSTTTMYMLINSPECCEEFQTSFPTLNHIPVNFCIRQLSRTPSIRILSYRPDTWQTQISCAGIETIKVHFLLGSKKFMFRYSALYCVRIFYNWSVVKLEMATVYVYVFISYCLLQWSGGNAFTPVVYPAKSLPSSQCGQSNPLQDDEQLISIIEMIKERIQSCI